ncbi:MAG: hypothetical protein AAF915_13975 [Cyanobacteria bacterium P01_D01_bin.50]
MQYIGRSVNVRRCWGNHHKYNALSKIGNVKITYLFVNADELLGCSHLFSVCGVLFSVSDKAINKTPEIVNMLILIAVA